MSKLPNVYQATITNPIKNNKDMCVVEEQIEDNNVQEVLRTIRTGLGTYNTKVEIETKNRIYETRIISKGKREIITEENQLIPIRDIIHIKIKK